MSTIIPQELEIEILSRLPAKSLQRFKIVCKAWHSLINTDPNFKASFRRRSFQNSQLLLLKHPPHLHSRTPIHFSVASPQSLVETSTLNLPTTVFPSVGNGDDQYQQHLLKPTRVELINTNSINGIVGIVVYTGLFAGPDVNCEMFLWNVSTGETVKIPKSELTGLFNGPPLVKYYHGFGLSKRDGEYKVVRVAYMYMRSEMYVCEGFNLRENCWKVLGKSNSSNLTNTLWASEMCTFVGQIGYWGMYKTEKKDSFCLLAFDFNKEAFKFLKLPENCVDCVELKYHSLWEYKGILAISVLRFGEFESGFTRHYIWGMMYSGENSKKFCKLFDIDLEFGPRRPVVTLRNGELVCVGEDEGDHVLYNHARGQVRRFGISDVDAVVLYTESLVSLKKYMPKQVGSSLN